MRTAVLEREGVSFARISDIEKHISVYSGDVADLECVSACLSGFKPEAVLHLAASYAIEHSARGLKEMFATNVLGTINLLEAARVSGTRLFVNTSTAFVYGPSDAPIREDAPLSPFNLYALTKIHAEQACDYYSRTFGLGCITLRLFPPYGPADHDRRLIPSIISGLLAGEAIPLTKGEQEWDFVHVNDVVRAFACALSRGARPGEHLLVNIGTGKAVAVRDIAEGLASVLGANACFDFGAIPYRKNEYMRLCADPSLARETLGWQAETDILTVGLEDTADHFRRLGA